MKTQEEFKTFCLEYIEFRRGFSKHYIHQKQYFTGVLMAIEDMELVSRYSPNEGFSILLSEIKSITANLNDLKKMPDGYLEEYRGHATELNRFASSIWEFFTTGKCQVLELEKKTRAMADAVKKTKPKPKAIPEPGK